MQKKSIFYILFLVCALTSNAQFYKSLLPSPGFTDSLNKVVASFADNYQNIQGELLPNQGEMNVYISKISLPGATHCIIHTSTSSKDKTASWQAIMYEGESYEEAVKIYKNTFRLVKKSKLRSKAGLNINLVGEMDEPNESIGFTTSTLTTETKDMAYKDFYCQVELTSNYSGWEVHVNLQNRVDEMIR